MIFIEKHKGFIRHVLINSFIGLVLVLVIHQFKDISWLMEKQDQALDWVMYFSADKDSEDLNPAIYIDVDNDTYEQWEEPLLLPIPKLVKILEPVLKGGPSSVVVDFDLHRRGLEELQLLESYIEKYAEIRASDSGSQLILIKTFSIKEVSSDYIILRNSPLDALVDKYPWLHWASPLFSQDQDYSVRRWRLWESACTQDGVPVAIPSVQMLVHANHSVDGGIPALNQELTKLLPNDCTSWAENLKTNKPIFNGITLSKDKSPLSRRIFFGMTWEEVSGEPYPMVKIKGKADLEQPLLTKVSAGLISENNNVDSDFFKGNWVIIGASHNESGDIHGTPLGYMPGSLIIVNSVNSLDERGELLNPSLLTTLIIELFLLVLISVAFAMLIPSVAFLLSTSFILLVLLPLTFWLFKDGVWLDFALPLFAVELHQLVSSAEKAYQNKFENN